MTTTQIKHTPLEILMLSQLATIREREAALRTRFQASTSGDADNMAAAVWELETHADRLNRMIDAMSFQA